MGRLAGTVAAGLRLGTTLAFQELLPMAAAYTTERFLLGHDNQEAATKALTTGFGGSLGSLAWAGAMTKGGKHPIPADFNRGGLIASQIGGRVLGYLGGSAIDQLANQVNQQERSGNG